MTRSLCSAHQRWTVPHGGVHLHVHDATVCWSRQCPERGGVTPTTDYAARIARLGGEQP